MTDEIKEIIEHIKTYPEKMYCLSEKEKVIMLDYITNLQQAIEIKNQRIKEEQQEKERYIKSYNGLNTWNKELKQENEKLKEEINKIKTLDRLRFNMLISHYGILNETMLEKMNLQKENILNGSDEE